MWWIPRQNRSGPSGFPCCTPSAGLVTPEQGRWWRVDWVNERVKLRGMFQNSSTLSLQIELKALLKSNFRRAVPFLTPYLSCRGARRSPIASDTLAPATLAARRRSVQPTAIGLTPPCFFRSAVRLAPKKKHRMDVGVLPSSTNWMKEARVGRRTWWLPLSDIMSLKCWGLRPSGPPLPLWRCGTGRLPQLEGWRHRGVGVGVSPGAPHRYSL